ncbi:formate--tetrahydrofolate ligase [Roseiflexus castenholzii]|uniref:Formate--tetrahydrofolate ligase n=1 Tax=Roseiflexus castenholzii (strain DSM 13941 / HLO8) TaxID=383372 RepID=FTHS_ROSCS|nr:formate--tetrahydrofolate ligase [Roseiflexus castenholzii]A7NGQ9.1 RecName: Full=Formate--tetrahydrofolate ligase; AltName: Full=Formyltetrahydrofolate synthetase; Short=FHS; Short=FTHFS [Roseiflexus castenholzii DSM 13941]ABU56652.1 Formate--tetrahydrofolate ligase [Roseiflexus castenholzii DSM 13941]
MRSDLDIAQAARLRPIRAVAADLGLTDDDIELYGRSIAKIDLGILQRLTDQPRGRYIVVTAITPTPLGEGKTTTTIGLGQALARLGKRSVVTIRQPSMGPTFGIKGGAAGGGYSQVLPMEQFNLHLTGDIHAIGAAHNLLAAMIDNHLHHGNQCGIDPYAIFWSRVVDISDRVLRNVVVGLGKKEDGPMRQTQFDITVASEVMAILALTTNLHDLRQRLGRIVAAYTRDGAPVTAEDLHAAGAMTVLLKEAIKPNLLQTLEGSPALVHCGPFANIAHGASSVLADMIGLHCADYVVTESGFGADIGFEKFCDIKCRASGLAPDAVVLVATVRALKAHSGRYTITAGRPLDPRLAEENPEDVADGAANLAAQVRIARLFGRPVVVAINRFPDDFPSEVEVIRQVARESGAFDVVESFVFAEGGAGGCDLARAAIQACEAPGTFTPLYPLDMSLREKIETLATKVYGATRVEYTPEASRRLAQFEHQGYGNLPICMAKTHLSISHDPKLRGAPSGYVFPIRDVRLAAGAGFIYPLAGDIRTMPGLPAHPAAERIDIDAEGRTRGLS